MSERYQPTAKYNVIYLYTINDESHYGKIKVGKTELYSVKSSTQLPPNSPEIVRAANDRIKEQTRVALINYELIHCELAVRNITLQDGTPYQDTYSDDDIHDVLKNSGYRPEVFRDSGRDSEWFTLNKEIVFKAIKAYKSGLSIIPKDNEVQTKAPKLKINLREEQSECVDKTISIFKKDNEMLWDCKMRFGKTVTAYELIRRVGFKKSIVITHRPAVEDSWDTDHELIFGGTNHRFVDKSNESLDGYNSIMDSANDKKIHDMVSQDIPFVYFASVQDLRGSQRVGGKYNKNNAVFDLDWDLVVVDEAHEGIQDNLGEEVVKLLRKKDTKLLSLTGTAYSLRKDYGDNVYTWTYVDEQKKKELWNNLHPNERNPYADLPSMNILTFDISDSMEDSYRFVTAESAFNFKEFFRTWTGDIAKDYYTVPQNKSTGDFVHEASVKSFLDLISREDETTNYPFSNEEYRDMFAHTFWIVPGVKEAKAFSTLLQHHPFFSSYKIVNVAGDGDEEEQYDIALNKVRNAIKENPRTITLSCGRLTTGITVKEWTGIMMLSGSADTAVNGYMQAIFRVQSPGVINGKRKENCYVFDFAPDRALRVIGKVHQLSTKTKNDDEAYKTALGEFINFCPIIAVEGTEMRTYDVPEMMRQIKRISVDSAINSGFDDNTIYLSDAGITRSDADLEILRKLSDVVAPKKKGQKDTHVLVNDHGMTGEERKKAEEAQKKKRQGRELTQEEKDALEKLKEAKKEQQKLFDLLRAVSIRLPLLFYGADADITQIIHLKDFVTLVDDESWEEFMPKGLRKQLFQDILRFYDEDVLIGAGLRIRKLAKAADEYPPTIRTAKIVEIISKFKNPDKETVLTPWRVVNMHLGQTLGGYNFYDDVYHQELDEPRFIEQDATADILLNMDVKVLELNSKSGLYPLYMAYSLYNFNLSGKEIDKSFDSLQALWNEVLKNNIYVLCKTKMARSITIRTLAGYTGATVNAIYLPHLIERMREEPERFKKKLTNPDTWEVKLKEGERMKFDAVIGNPPYQGENHSQIYPFFYTNAINISNKYVSLIFPVGWQQPKNANNLKVLNNEIIKTDRQIVYINNMQNVFPTVSGAEWVNIVLWKRNYDNGLDGDQLIYTNGLDPKEISLAWESSIQEKPTEIIELANKVMNSLYFESVQIDTSVRKPYGLSTDVYEDPIKYKIDSSLLYENREHNEDYLVYCKNSMIRYMDIRVKLPKIGRAMEKYKVFVGYAWGNMSEKTGLGGAFSDIIIAFPHEICTETYLESGCFDTFEKARKHAKYLMTKFARALLYLNKFSQHSTTAWGAVPVQDYSEEWWDKSIAEIDEELFKKYGVSDEIAQFVRENIQTKSESNIVNFNKGND